MPANSLHPTIQPWFITELENQNATFFFQFNPSRMRVTYASEWEQKYVSNIAIETSTFKSRKPKVFEFELFLNEWGMHTDPYNTQSAITTVEEQIQWLRKRTIPRNRKESKVYRPPTLLFFWNKFEPVVITSLKIKRTHFRPIEGAEANGFGQAQPSDIFEYTLFRIQSEIIQNGGSNAPFVSSRFDRQVKPNDAIRATVSVRLLEFRESDQPTGVFEFKGSDLMSKIMTSSALQGAKNFFVDFAKTVKSGFDSLGE